MLRLARRLCGRHYTHLPLPPAPPPPPPRASSPTREIIRLCDAGAVCAAVRLLNSADALRLPSKPLLYASLLQASPSRPLGLSLHSHVLRSALVADRFVANALLSFYFKACLDVALTRQVFDELPTRDVVAWTSMLSAYVRAGRPSDALHVFDEMSTAGVEPNAFTLSASIKASSELGHLRLGSCFHGMVLVSGFVQNMVIGSALIDMYGRCFTSEDASRVFKEMLEPDAICWTSVISAFTRNSRFEESLGAFYQMMRRLVGVLPDDFTYGSIMTALGNLGRARQGKEAHAQVIVSGLCGNVVVESSILDMYAKCRLVEDSRKVFDQMPTKNAISWTALLGGYCENGDYETVLFLFKEMDRENDGYGFGTVLRACAGLAAVRPGKEVHCRFLRIGGFQDVVVESALVDLYAKCGLVDYAFRVFMKTPFRNVITWNAMICGFAQNGKGKQAVELFNELVKEESRPDYITFIGVLFACSHTGMVEDGRRYFKSMSEDYGILPGVEHYNCMVDLFSRAGLLEEAEDLINKSVYGDDSSLSAALLGACATHYNHDVAERVAKKMMVLEPQHHLSYILLSNVYKAVGRWEDALEIRRLMIARDIMKTPAKSCIEVDQSKCPNMSGPSLVKIETEVFEHKNIGEEIVNSL